MTEGFRGSIRIMNEWLVPTFDPTVKCWVAWNDDFGGYILITQPPEGGRYCYPGDKLRGTLDEREAQRRDECLPTLPALMVATAAAIRWAEVPPRVIADLEHAPTAAFLGTEHTGRREQVVAMTLRMALSA